MADCVEIKLTFDKYITNLSGNIFGKNTFTEQADGKFTMGENVCFVFPANIEEIASSFIQGFFAGMVKNLGINKTEEVVEIKAEGIEDAKNYVFNKLRF